MGDAAQKLGDQPAIQAVGWLSTSALAEVLGRESARSAMGWCRRHGIEVVRDGKWNFVRLEDVQRALARLAGGAESEMDKAIRESAKQFFG